jgi:hypothetical protein
MREAFICLNASRNSFTVYSEDASTSMSRARQIVAGGLAFGAYSRLIIGPGSKVFKTESLSERAARKKGRAKVFSSSHKTHRLVPMTSA